MIPVWTVRIKRKAVIFAVTTLAFSATALPVVAASSAVATLIGTWGGNGRITYTDGTSEGIHCNAYYTGGGDELRMAIQCRSEKNPINIRSQLRVDGSRVSGTWEERTFNASGNASGSASGGKMSLKISGGGFNGTMNLSFSKNSQSVSISTTGIAMSRATMNFSRR